MYTVKIETELKIEHAKCETIDQMIDLIREMHKENADEILSMEVKKVY